MSRKDVVQALSTVLRKRRERAGLSQEELAHRAGVHSTYISLLERGKRNMTVVVLFELVDALGTKASTVVKDVERTIADR